jgi:hypothetical protein
MHSFSNSNLFHFFIMCLWKSKIQIYHPFFKDTFDLFFWDYICISVIKGTIIFLIIHPSILYYFIIFRVHDIGYNWISFFLGEARVSSQIPSVQCILLIPTLHDPIFESAKILGNSYYYWQSERLKKKINKLSKKMLK